MVFKPIELEELCKEAKIVFCAQDGNKGSHAVIDTPWQNILSQFSGLIDTDQLLANLRSRSIAILDEGCGSSFTLFEAVEFLENLCGEQIINGYGVTASPQFLSRCDFPQFKDKLLEHYVKGSKEYERASLLFDGVQGDEKTGLYRCSPAGNFMRFRKGDLHDLDKLFPSQKFDLIYSSSTYPHLLCPWLVFEKSCNALEEGGFLLINDVPLQDIIDREEVPITLDECKDLLKKANPGYKFHFKSTSNPFYSPVVVEKKTKENLNLPLLFGRSTKLGYRLVGLISNN